MYIFLFTEYRLVAYADIFLHPFFIQELWTFREESQSKYLSRIGFRFSVSHYEVGRATQSDDLSLAARAMNKRLLESSSKKYIDLNFLRPTSIIFKRLFSQALYALYVRRQNKHPSDFEFQTILQINKQPWTMEDVSKIVN